MAIKDVEEGIGKQQLCTFWIMVALILLRTTHTQAQ